MYKLMLLSLLALLIPATAAATVSSGGETFVPAEGLDLSRSFEAQRAAIIKALDDGETYSEIAADDQLVVKASLHQISGLLGNAAHVNQLPPETKVKVFNEQERINTLLVQAHKDSRVICKRERATGSNMSTNICSTVAERRRQHEAARDFFRFNKRGEVPALD